MKTRSSSGVGQKIELEFNVETLRISDPNPDEHSNYKAQPSANEIMSRIKPNLETTNDKVHESIEPVEQRVTASPQTNKLKSLLNSLKK
jgi:hypothetical protein